MSRWAALSDLSRSGDRLGRAAPAWRPVGDESLALGRESTEGTFPEGDGTDTVRFGRLLHPIRKMDPFFGSDAMLIQETRAPFDQGKPIPLFLDDALGPIRETTGLRFVSSPDRHPSYSMGPMESTPPDPIEIFVDADACPVKAEVYRVAERHRVGVKVVVANSFIAVPRDPARRAGGRRRRVSTRRTTGSPNAPGAAPWW